MTLSESVTKALDEAERLARTAEEHYASGGYAQSVAYAEDVANRLGGPIGKLAGAHDPAAALRAAAGWREIMALHKHCDRSCHVAGVVARALGVDVTDGGGS